MSKYRNRKCTMYGKTFDSMKEANRYADLRNLERAGKVSAIECQPVFPIVIDAVKVRALPDKRGRKGRHIVYKADFSYYDHDRHKRIVEDVKGMDTPVSRLKRALVQHIYGVTVEIV